jgi:hypothetical protein
MKLITQRDMIVESIAEFIERYSKGTGASPLMLDKVRLLKQLDPLTCSPSLVNAHIGNQSWTSLYCDQCKNAVEAVIDLGEEPNYGSHTASVCKNCLEKALNLLDTQNIEA